MSIMDREKEIPTNETEKLKQALEKQQFFNKLLEREVQDLKAQLAEHEQGVQNEETGIWSGNGDGRVSRSAFFAVLFVSIGLAGALGYKYYSDSRNNNDEPVTRYIPDSLSTSEQARVLSTPSLKDFDDEGAIASKPVTRAEQERKQEPEPETREPERPKAAEKTTTTPPKKAEQATAATPEPVDTDEEEQTDDYWADSPSLGQYKVKSKAYFHNKPNENSRRNAFIVHWNNAVLSALDETNDFIFVVFTNHEGQTSRGWLKKADLFQVN
jgi:eukaryotic-like serine/threonine-protein kinase